MAGQAPAVVPSVQAAFRLPGFRADWRHCSRSSNLLARLGLGVTALPTADWNLVSCVVNEVLEFAYHVAGDAAPLQIEVCRDGAARVTAQMQLRPELKPLVLPGLSALADGDADRRFQQQVQALPDPCFGLLWLVADLGVVVERAELDEQGELKLRLLLPETPP